MCSSFQTGIKLLSDTNVAVVTSTIAIGHFDIQATVIPQNNTGTDELIRSIPIRRKNVIHLGHTQNDLNKISKLLNPPTQLESLAEKTSSNISDGLVNGKESEDDEDYSDVDSNEDFKNHHNQLSKLRNNQFMKTNDHTSNSDAGNKFNEQNHKVNHFNQPMINQLHHQRKGQSHLQENQLHHPLDTNSVQANNQLNHEAYQPVNNQIIPQQNRLFNQPTLNQFIQQQNGLLQHLISNQPNDGFNLAVNQFQEKTFNQPAMNHPVRNLLSKQNIKLDQPLNNPTQNHFSQQHNSHLSQLLNHQRDQFNQQDSQGNEQHSTRNQQNAQLYLTGNQFTPNEQQNTEFSHTKNHPIGNQWADNLKHAVNNLVGNQFIQHQNAHINEPMNHLSNSVNQPQDQLISHIISQLTGIQNSVKQPNELIQTASNQWTQLTNETNQLVNQLIKSEVQHNDLSNKPARQLNDIMTNLMNVLSLTPDRQVPEQQNDPSNQLANILIHPERNHISQQNVEISLPATQSIHPARMQFMIQENDHNKQFINAASSHSPQQQNTQTHKPTIHPNHPKTTSLMEPSASVQLNQLAHIVGNILAQKQNAQTNQNEMVIHTGNNQLMPQKNGQFNHIRSNQITLPQNTRFSRSMSQLTDTGNDQAIYVTYNQSKQPTDVIINSAENHISNSSKFNGTENNLMHLIHSQVTNQKTEQNSQSDNKLIQPMINEMGKSPSISANQLSDNHDSCKYKSKATYLAVNSTKDQSHQMKEFLPANHNMLPVINDFNNISSSHPIHRENSRFANHDKNVFPYTTQNKTVDHEPSQNKDEMTVFKTSTDFHVTNN